MIEDSWQSYPISIGMCQQGGKYKGNQTMHKKIFIGVDFIDEVELDVVPLDVCGSLFWSPYNTFKIHYSLIYQPIPHD